MIVKMIKRIVFFDIFIIFTYFTSPVSLDKNSKKKATEATNIAKETYYELYYLFLACIGSDIPDEQLTPNILRNRMKNPSKTTVGFAPKYTGNRKFFANLVNTKAFKEALNKDAAELWKKSQNKMKYCDNVVMVPETLQDFYYREVDLSKL